MMLHTNHLNHFDHAFLCWMYWWMVGPHQLLNDTQITNVSPNANWDTILDPKFIKLFLKWQIACQMNKLNAIEWYVMLVLLVDSTYILVFPLPTAKWTLQSSWIKHSRPKLWKFFEWAGEYIPRKVSWWFPQNEMPFWSYVWMAVPHKFSLPIQSNYITPKKMKAMNPRSSITFLKEMENYGPKKHINDHDWMASYFCLMGGYLGYISLHLHPHQ